MICETESKAVPPNLLWFADGDRIPTVDNNCGAKTDDSDVSL